MRDQETIEQACERIVRQEVLCCVSGIVNTLAAAWDVDHVNDVMDELHEKAQELQSPVLDWEEAATQAGWKVETFTAAQPPFAKSVQWIKSEAMPHGNYNTAQEACEAHDIEPYKWEVFEHWAVSQWLADALIAQGERVDTDFEGLCVWARTTTGQGIAQDSVIRHVVEKLRADYAALTAKHA